MGDKRPAELLEAANMERTMKRPFAGIQWKGTDVCMDVHCDCGEEYHVDGDFVYFVKCGHCGRTFYCGSRIELIEMACEQESCVATGEVWAVNEERDQVSRCAE